MMPTPSQLCSVCGARSAPDETACRSCGLVFASRQEAAAPPPTLATQASLRPGQSVARGRYTIQRSLSHGGMGAIYLAADHEAFDRLVVVKAMLDYFDPSSLQNAQAARARFVQEARTLASVRHPAIPQIYTYFQDGAHNYIVMEYIEGQDLEQGLTRHDDAGPLISGRPYALHDVVRWGAALCRVLEYLAGCRPSPVIHHDIKPANLILDRNSDDIRLVDFGTARARLLQPGDVGLQQSSLYGTTGYAAPEQYHGASEPRSDVYALAATLYHLATDDDPRGHPFSFPRLRQLGALGPILGAALSHDVALRPTAAALRKRLEALHALAAARPIQAPDGAALPDEAALVAWCETHWVEAAEWLYDRLPDQLQLIWGHATSARALRAIARRAANRDAGLDAALARLDPRGFGAAQPALDASRTLLDYGVIGEPANPHDRCVTFTNTGRRYVRATIEPPGWLRARTPTIALRPGQRQTVTLEASAWHARLPRAAQAGVRVTQGRSTLLHIRAQARGSTATLQLILLALIVPLLCLGWAIRAGADRPGIFDRAPAPRQPAPIGILTSRPAPTIAPPRTESWPRGGARLEVARDGQGSGVSAIAWSDNGELLMSGGEDGSLRLRRADGTVIRALDPDRGRITAIAFSPDGRFYATSSASATVKLRRVSDDALVAYLPGNTAPIVRVAFSPDGTILATGDHAHVITLWRLADGSRLHTLRDASGFLTSLAFSPDGTTLASAGSGAVNLWSVADGRLIWTIGTPNTTVWSVAFSPDGTQIASGDGEQQIMLWLSKDGTPLDRIVGHTAAVESVAFCPDGTTLASAGRDGTVRLWRAVDRALLQTLDGRADVVTSIAFSPDGTTLASSGTDGLLKLWRLAR